MAFREKKRLIIWLPVVVFLLGVGGLLFQSIRFVWGRVAGDFFYPYLEVGRSGREVISDKALLAQDKYELIAEIESLRRQNRLLSSRSAGMGELMLANEDLRRMLNLNGYVGYKNVPAEVILRDPIFWDESIIINRGRKDNISSGAGVLSVDALTGTAELIGVVKDVTEHTARVVTLYNPEAKLSVCLPDSDAIGFINAENQVNISGMVGFLPIGKNYTIGERVETTGFEPNIPSGIKVGTLSEIENSDRMYGGKTYVNGRVQPIGNLSNLRFVIVVVRDNSADGVL